MKTTEYNVKIPGLNERLRFAVIADLHGHATPELTELALGAMPDAVLMPGDIFDTRGDTPGTLAAIKALAANVPVFCSLCNHDKHMSDETRTMLLEAGAVLLDNDTAAFRGLTIGGLTSGFFTEHRTDLEKTPPPDLDWLARFAAMPSPRLLLCHHPEYYPDYIRGTDIELTVSGHAPGGQWSIFGRGVFAPGQGLFPKYTAGVYDGGRLVVSRGVTNTVRIPRFFNPTEIVVINAE